MDGELRPTLTMSLAKWRALAGLMGNEDEARTRIRVTSAAPGACTLAFFFSAGGMLTDSVMQRITFVRPPLRLDVNGTFDLVNFFPVALDLAAFASAWHGNVTYTVKPRWGAVNAFNYCFADVPWNKAGSIQTTNVTNDLTMGV